MQRSIEGNRDASRGSVAGDSDASFKTQQSKTKEKNGRGSPASDSARTRTQDHDRDSGSYNSEDYENGSLSRSSLSGSSRSLSPGPRTVGRAKRISGSPLLKRGLQKVGSRHLRPGVPVQRGGVRSQSLNKDPSPKDLDLVTKRMLSARLLKINELKNELAETQLRLQQLQKENKVLRQLQLRQERALNRFEDTESEITQLISRHSGEVHVLRERLRRSRERERDAERRLRDAQDELHRCRTALQKLRRLAEDRRLGEREELARKLEQVEGRLGESERRVKELERSLELSSSSFQRHLAAERKKSHEFQTEVKTLNAELERLGLKLKEKEKELDTRNIYANRMRAAPKRDPDSAAKKRGGPAAELLSGSTRSTTKSVQTEDRMLSLEFPTPPPGVVDREEAPRGDDYLSLKEAPEREKRPKAADRERREERHQEHEVLELEEKPRKLRGGLKKDDGDRRRNDFMLHKEEEKRTVQNWPQVQEREEEELSRKDHLLAKMREIDEQDRDALLRPLPTSPRLSGSRNQNGSVFGFTDPGETFQNGGREPPRKAEPLGRRGLLALGSSEEFMFGSYAPSFGRPAGKAGPPGPPGARGDGAEERHRDGPGVAAPSVKDRKSALMQQLFGSSSSISSSAAGCSKMEVLSTPGAVQSVLGESGRKRDDSFPFDRGQAAGCGTGAESRAAPRTATSFDDDVEEVTL
ncbi:lebercilin isoform X2 [Scleropages formosus]|uniref:lebercilin isoform X2 n=1 Tax=Scleropages formosus TaxID=113540 RepID=UPI0010FA694E|nr:lebercilin isoform X2 [Scleropages formosus]